MWDLVCCLVFGTFISVQLAIISILAFQLFIPASLPWTVTNIVGSAAKIVVTWKTGNIYGAALMSITSNLIDILIQII